MSSPDPEDPQATGTGRGRDGRPDDRRREARLPDDVDAEFAAIIASWAAGDAPRWPGAEGRDTPQGPADGERAAGVGLVTPPGGEPRPEPPTGRPPEPPRIEPPHVEPPRSAPDDAPAGRTVPVPGQPPGPRDHTPPADPEDEHFVPPDPPPLPRVGLSSVLGLLLLVAGVVLLAVPGVLGGALGVGIVPGLLAMTAGLGWLVFGLRRPAERGDGPDEHGEV